MKTLKILCALVGMMVLSPTSTTALTVIPMDLGDLTAEAELIFIGTVTNIRSERKPNTIYTYVIFSELRTVKGIYLQETIEVRLTGGTVAGETLSIPGMPKFIVGDRDLIFLAGNLRYICPIVGWGQGRFKIRWDEAFGQDAVFDDADTPVTGVVGDEIIRAKTAVNLQESSPGVPDSGETPVPQAQELETRASLESLIAAIETKMGIR